MRSSTWPGLAASGGSCPMTFRPGRRSATTFTPGVMPGSGSGSTASCGVMCGCCWTGRKRPALVSSTVSRSKQRKRVAPRATTGGKKVAGRKRHLLVDTLGLIWGLAVLPAGPTDWDGAVEVFRRVGRGLPRLARVWADAAYRALADWVQTNVRWVLDIVTRREGAVGFQVQPWRWVVERTFGWFNRYRRLSKDYEHNPKSSEAWIYITAIHRMSRFMLPQRDRDNHLLKRPRRKRKR